MSVDLSIVGKLADMMRDKGIRSIKWGDVQLELGPREVELAPSKAVDDDMCGCGHPSYHHNGDAGCLKGCAPEKCSPEAQA